MSWIANKLHVTPWQLFSRMAGEGAIVAAGSDVSSSAASYTIVGERASGRLLRALDA